jgi:DNA gyrase subunit A
MKFQKVLSMPADDKVRSYVKIKDLTDKEYAQSNFIVFATKNGLIKKTAVEHFTRPRNGGITAIDIREDDQLVEAKLTNGNCEVLIANRNGRTIRFPESRVRPMLRASTGVAGLEIDEDGTDFVVGMITVEKGDAETSVMIISENGYGKRTDVEDYRLVNNRGGRGVKTMDLNDKTGKVVAIKSVKDTEDLIVTTKSGITIRMDVASIRIQGRATQGVRIIRLDEGEEIADVALIEDIAEEEGEIILGEDGEPIVNSTETDENTEGADSDETTTDEVAE